jgi:predicted PurR-regulated permease PerM
MAQVWTSFWRGSIIAALMTGGVAYLQLLLMGIPYAGFLAVIAGLMTFIPWVGAIIAAIPMFIIPLTMGSTTLDMDPLTLAIVVTVIYQLIQLVLWNFVIPKLYGKVLDLSASFLVIVIGIGTAWWGLLGAILAIPVAVILLQAVKYALHKIRGGDPYPDEPMPNLLTKGAFGMGPLAPEETGEA